MPANRGLDLVRRATRGEPAAIDALLEQHLPALVAYVRLHSDRVIREHESCADIVQSVCLDVLASGDCFEYRGEGPFRKWLFAKALGKLVDRKRYYLAAKRDAGRLLVPSPARTDLDIENAYVSMCSPSRMAIGREDLARFERAFDMLPPEYKQVISAARILGLSHAEIAVDMGRSEGAVRALLHRALGRLGLLMHAAAQGENGGQAAPC